MPVLTNLRSAVAAAMLAALGAALYLRPPSRRELAVVVLIPALFLMLVILISLKHPIMVARILTWMTIPMALATARALVVPSRARGIAGALAVVTLAVGLTWQMGFPEGSKEPWRDALGAVASDLARADMVVLARSERRDSWAANGIVVSQDVDLDRIRKRFAAGLSISSGTPAVPSGLLSST
jgi:hypothetical protein